VAEDSKSDPKSPPPRRGPWRAIVFLGILAATIALAFVVARARLETAASNPYAGARGASRAKASGIEVVYRRGGESRVLEPGTPLRPGDVLSFTVKSERPRYLALQVRDDNHPTETVFPAAAADAPAPTAVLVQPGQKLPPATTVLGGIENLIVSAIFADHPFTAGEPPPDGEMVTLVIDKAP
jgi:hypothetical protein